jgi:hypothetical protein
VVLVLVLVLVVLALAAAFDRAKANGFENRAVGPLVGGVGGDSAAV